MKLEIHWPSKDRIFCRKNEPLLCTNPNLSGKRKKKYEVVNPGNGEKLSLIVDDKSPYGYLKGSWRRWYFGKKRSLSQDLNRRQFYEVVNLLSEITGIPVGAIMAANIKRVELGFNVKLKRDHDLFIPSLHKYGKLKRMIVEGETVKFLGSKMTFKCYDKGKHLLPKIAKRKIANKINKYLMFMRLELELTSISATKFNYLKHPFDIYKRWDYLLEELCAIITSDIETVDLFSSDLDFTQFPKTLSEFQELFAYKAIKKEGIDNAILLINRKSKFKSKASSNRKKIYEIFHSHKSVDKQNVIREIHEKIRIKANNLK